MTEAVEQRGGQLLIAEDLDPLGEREVGSDDRGVAFVAVGEQVEELFAGGDHVQLAGQAAAPVSDCLAPLFIGAPVPCAWDLTIVPSSASVTRSAPANASRRSSAASRSKAPALAQRLGCT